MRRIIVSILMLGLASTCLPSADAEDAYEEARSEYERDIHKYTSLYRRDQIWTAFAKTGDARALKILTKRYENPDRPRPQERFLIAYACGKYFRDKPHVAVWDKWTAKANAPKDAWLHYQAMRAIGVHVDLGETLAEALRERSVFVRAAALEGLAEAEPTLIAPLATALLDDLPHSPFERDVILHAAAYAALQLVAPGTAAPVRVWAPRLDPAVLPPPPHQVPAIRKFFERLISIADQDQTSARARLVIMRHVAHAVGLKDVPTHTDYLRDVLEGGKPPGTAGERYGRPSFMGLKASGTRICYVLDMSDSMCKPLTDEERKVLRGPVTPGDGKEAPPTPQGPVLPWDRIHTRFDAAREYLKASVRDLSEGQYFGVVWFGSDADLLGGCSGMRPWSKGYARTICAALDRIRMKKETSDRAHGRLRGDTNLHAGMRRAFQMTSRGAVGAYSYVNKKAILQGCDTVFLLSDGAPTEDDWKGRDPGMASGSHYDPETGERSPGAGKPHHSDNVGYRGPYARASQALISDVRRLNLFRRAEIHCIGIGEANMWLLRAIADIGLGKTREIGKKK